MALASVHAGHLKDVSWAATQVFFTPLSQALRLTIHLGEPLPEDRLDTFQFITN